MVVIVVSARPSENRSMALELRPICENCAVELPPSATNVMICSFECTFCSDCVELLANVCPNCGGGFAARPIRPQTNWNSDNYLGKYPASTVRRHRPIDLDAHRKFVETIASLPPPMR
jgi:uncharacterized protein